MKSQIRKTEAEMARYSEEYKQQAVERWRSSGRSAAKVGAELGIRPALIFRWAKAQRGQKFPDFSARAALAGVHGYTAFLRGKRVIYSGRQGAQHTEWFPGANPRPSASP